MHCPNCGLEHSNDARFCGNCGTPFNQAPPAGYQTQSTAPPPNTGPYRMAPGSSRTTAQNIGLGCLIALVIFFFLGLSCTRACFFGHRYRTHIYRRY